MRREVRRLTRRTPHQKRHRKTAHDRVLRMAETRMFNVRVEDDLWNQIEQASTTCGLGKSAWAREVLAVAASHVTGEKPPNPHMPRYLDLQHRQLDRNRQELRCVHPVTGIIQMPFTDVCGVCKTVVRTR